MVPKDRIELSADPYQGSVLPLNYIGVFLSFSFYHNLIYISIKMVFETGVEPISSPSEGEILSIELLEHLEDSSYSQVVPNCSAKSNQSSNFTLPSLITLSSSPSISKSLSVSIFP